jgi:hypothetical protein
MLKCSMGRWVACLLGCICDSCAQEVTGELRSGAAIQSGGRRPHESVLESHETTAGPPRAGFLPASIQSAADPFPSVA